MRDEPKKVTGGCLCGKVRYEAQVFLKTGYYCHCRICQKSSGQPADISVPIKAGTLVFTKSDQGLSNVEIAKRLNEMGLTTSRGKPWTRETVWVVRFPKGSSRPSKRIRKAS